ncbi:LysR substrate-binding domain-containing protein [Aurantivibrio plasticivorans]
MDLRQLARIDLNLLVALQVLIEECNVSKAADRLFITQSAMSKTLGRLRDLFGDPLFTRSSHGMVPTPRAAEIQNELTAILQSVQGLVVEQQFDPWTYSGEIKVAIPEYVGMVVLPTLIEELQHEAPNIKIVSITRIEHQLERLAVGDLDIAIHVKHSQYPSDFTLDPIASLPPVLLVRQAHPLRAAKKEISHWQELLDIVQRYPQVGLYVPDLDELEMGQLGRPQQAQVVFETSHMFSAIEVVRRTNCVLFGPPFITRHPALGVGLAAIKLPVQEESYIHYVMVTHRRVESSAPHQYIRQKILSIVRRLEQQEQSGDPYSDYRTDRQIGFYGRGRRRDSNTD